MIKLLILILILFSGCSLDTKTGLWNENIEIDKKQVSETKKEDSNENKILINEFNPNLGISLLEDFNKTIFNDLQNNNGRKRYTNSQNIFLKYKFEKIDNFNEKSVNLINDNDELIFFDGDGSIFKIDNSKKNIWKKNVYTKQEKKSDIALNFGKYLESLIVTDNIGKFYKLDLKTGNLIWSKINTSPFNSEIKIFKDKIYLVDLENKIHCFSALDGTRLWNYQTDNFFIKSQKKLSIVLDEGIVYFNNSVGDITALNAESGTLVWQTPTQNSFAYASTILLETSELVIDENSIYFSNNQNEFYSLDKLTGFINWKQSINSDLRPIISNNLIFTVSLEGFLFVVEKNTGNIIRVSNLFKNFKEKNRNKIKPIGFEIGFDKLYLTLNNGSIIISNVQKSEINSIMKISKKNISRPYINNNRLFVINHNTIFQLN